MWVGITQRYPSHWILDSVLFTVLPGNSASFGEDWNISKRGETWELPNNYLKVNEHV